MNEELKALEGISAPSLKEFWAWVKKTFTPAYRNEIEHYLSQATDHGDLEYRIKVLTRRGLLC